MGLVAGLAFVCFAQRANAVDPNRLIAQYLRDYWDREKGFAGGSVSAFAQTPDGYLWIGTDKGLLRFDGLTFRAFPQAGLTKFPIGPVQGLVADAQGNLWILLQSTKILRYHQGKFEVGRDEAEVGITSVSLRRDGTVLFASLALGPLAYSGGRFVVLNPSSEPVGGPFAVSTEDSDTSSSRLSWATGVATHRFAEPNSAVISMAETSEGRIWLGTRDKGLFYMTGARLSALGKGLPANQITCLLPLENGELWIGTEKGVVRWSREALTVAGIPTALRHAAALSMIRDRDSNIWVGTADGLLRVNADSVASDRNSYATIGPVTALFEDREGNLWAGGPRGIERLRDSAFVTYSVAGLASESSGPIYVDADEQAWFAPFEGGLHWLKGKNSGSVTNDGLSQDVVYSIAGSKRELWIGRQQGGLTHLSHNGSSVTTKTYTQADGLAQNSVFAVYQSRDGSVWAGTLNEGVSEYRSGRFRTYTTANGMASNTIASIAESPDGTVWFATPNGLSSLSPDRHWTTYTARDGLPSENVNCLFEDSSGILWTGTSDGLAFFRSGRIQVPDHLPASLHEQILGIAEDRNGWLWIATSNHVLAAKRDRLLGAALGDIDIREFGPEDGLRGEEGVRRHQSVIADPVGRIWFSMNRGLSVVDPKRAEGSSPPAIVQILGISADGSPIAPEGTVRIPPGGHRVTFTYTGLSLSAPERVKFKYRLDGFDRGWSESVSAREAAYTNLGSGSYRFRVIASNGNGIWNSAETAIPFTVASAYWQTWWFRLAGVFLAGLTTLTIFRLRYLRRTTQMSIRFEERLAERTRVAQELHDTLLQGVISASMQLHVITDQLPADSPAKPRLGRILDLIARVIDEGRNAVGGLRSPNSGNLDLGEAFSKISQEFVGKESTGFRILQEGTPRTVHPIIRDEIYSIGREALTNAFRHSQASSIELELEYASSGLRVLVRDNGVGFDPKVLQFGRDGHWGLSGMRERAKRIGAKFRVFSRLAAGTEVELSVPSHIAFGQQPSNGGSGGLTGRFFRTLRNTAKASTGWGQ